MKKLIIYFLGSWFLCIALLGCSQQESATEEATSKKAPAAEQTSSAVEETAPPEDNITNTRMMANCFIEDTFQ